MASLRFLLNPVAAAMLGLAALTLPVGAQAVDEAGLLERLAQRDLDNWQRVERDLMNIWSQSGSDSMDLLLRRGRRAIIEGDFEAAIEHLGALTDHAPDFAEGWHTRASAYYHLGLYGPAMEDLARALQLNPNHFAAIGAVAIILEESGFHRQALEVYRAAQAIHPHHPNIRRRLEELEQQLAGSAA